MTDWARPGQDPTAGDFVYATYEQVAVRVANLAGGLAQLELPPGSRVGIYAGNCPEWTIADLACMSLSLVSVPLYDSLGPDAIEYVLEHAEVSDAARRKVAPR